MMAMSLVWMFVFLSSCACQNGQVGVQFVYVGQTHMSYSAWLVHFTFSVQPFASQLRSLSENLQVFSSSLSKFRFLAADPVLAEVHRNIENLFKEEVSALDDRLKEVIRSYREMRSVVTPVSQSRPKRSLLPLGGVLSQLFGVADDSQVQRLKDNVDILRRSQEKVIHVIDSSLTILNSTRQDVKRNRAQINSLIQKTLIMTHKIDSIYDAIQQEVKPEILFLELVTEFNMIVRAYTETLAKLSSDMADFQEAISTALRGSLSVRLVPPRRLLSVLKKIQRQIPPSLELPFPLDDLEVFEYYRSLTATLLPDKKVFHILTVIPLLHKASRFEIYKVVTLPIPDFRSSSQLELKAESPYLALSLDRNRYALLTTADIEYCESNQLVYCTVHKAIFSTASAPSCLSALFLDDTVTSRKYCQYDQVENPRSPIVKALAPGVWFVSSRDKIVSDLICSNKSRVTSRIMIEQGISVVRVPPGCAVYSAVMQLPHILQHHSKVSFKQPLPHVFNFSLVSEMSTPALVSHRPTESSVPETMSPVTDYDIGTLRDDLDSARNELGKMDSPNSPAEFSYKISLISLGSVLVVVILIVIVVFMYRRINVCKERPKRNDNLAVRYVPARRDDHVTPMDIDCDMTDETNEANVHTVQATVTSPLDHSLSYASRLGSRKRLREDEDERAHPPKFLRSENASL